MSSQYGEQIGDALAQINVIRDRLGYDMLPELPSATRGDPAACLFYRAMPEFCTGVYGESITFKDERVAQLAAELWGTRASGRNVRPPSQIERTVHDFDASKFGYYFDHD